MDKSNSMSSTSSSRSSVSSEDSNHIDERMMCSFTTQNSKMYIQSLESKQVISSSMDFVLKSFEKLQANCREKMATTSSSQQKNELESLFDEFLKNFGKSNQEIKTQLEKTESMAMEGLGKISVLSAMFTLLKEETDFNEYVKKPITSTELEFKQTVVNYLRQDDNKLSTDEFCTWIGEQYKKVSNGFTLFSDATDCTEDDVESVGYQVVYFLRALAFAAAEISIESNGDNAKLNFLFFNYWMPVLKKIREIVIQKENELLGSLVLFVFLFKFRSVLAQFFPTPLEASGVMERIIEFFCKEDFIPWREIYFNFEEFSPENELKVKIHVLTTFLSEFDS